MAGVTTASEALPPGVKLGFDATAVMAAGKGMARFQSEFLRAVADLGVVEELTVFITEDAERPRLPQPRGWRYVEVSPRPMILWEQIGMPRAARRAGLDLVITASERAALWGPPRVVFIFEHPGRRRDRQRDVGTPFRQRLVNTTTVALFPMAMRRAAAVLAASASTAHDMRPVEARVVHLGVGREFSPDAAAGERARRRLQAPDGYFLHLASDDPRENNEVVLEALAVLARGRVRPVLAIAGAARARRRALEALAGRLDIAEQVRWLGFVADADLVDLYRGALAYLDPSLYEGLPLQPLEAMACATPTITSNVTSFPELVGDAGILLDPADIEGFAAAMGQLLENPGALADLRERALRRSAEFTWERTARSTVAACAEVLSR